MWLIVLFRDEGLEEVDEGHADKDDEGLDPRCGGIYMG
jgi:hypothetical protein